MHQFCIHLVSLSRVLRTRTNLSFATFTDRKEEEKRAPIPFPHWFFVHDVKISLPLVFMRVCIHLSGGSWLPARPSFPHGCMGCQSKETKKESWIKGSKVKFFYAREAKAVNEKKVSPLNPLILAPDNKCKHSLFDPRTHKRRVTDCETFAQQVLFCNRDLA